MPNHLGNETSPYLLQHANNPVDWYPWGEEALGRARQEDKPILLSIGYSACHWCHVMERESFENLAIARIMNAHFINIKVDREERPDLDSVYMEAVQAMTGAGGWPMTLFLTPEGKPFFGGTYFPPTDLGGRPGFTRVLLGMADAYRSKQGSITQSITQLMTHLGQSALISRSMDPLTADALHQAYQGLAPSFDDGDGGFGNAPKFPQPMIYELLLRYQLRANNPRALKMVETTLEAMAHGGMYDQVGGGFHRYSTDPVWLVPHFEKMLYDNALLSVLYLHAFQATSKPFYRRIAEEVLDYVFREMTDPAGGFYSTQDADSEGEEGKFFIWTPEELNEVLGLQDGTLVGGYFGFTEAGNFEGRNIPHLPHDADDYARKMGLSRDELDDVVQRARAILLQAREKRVHPGRDEKILTAWNGLMLRAFAEASSILGRKDYRQVAVNNAHFLLGQMSPGGRLLRSYKDDQARVKGYLEDYAFLADGLVALYENTFDQRWLDNAVDLADQMIDLFWDEEQGIFFDTGNDAEQLIIRPRDIFDSATPCGGSVAASVLLKLSVFTGDNSYAQRAATTLRGMQPAMASHPMGMGNWLATLDFYLTPTKEIAILGHASDSETQELMAAVHRSYQPNKVVGGSIPSDGQARAKQLPLLEGKEMLYGKATAYVCRDYVCLLPVTDPETLEAQLLA